MYNSTYWSIETLFLYILLSFWGMYCIGKYIKTSENTIRHKSTSWIYGWGLIIVWTFVATFRMANGHIGGSDTLGYIWFFENCFKNNLELYDHSAKDLAFLWSNRIIRVFSSNYHLYFAAIYSFMAYVYLKYCKKFSSKSFSIIPFILVFFLYLRSFSSIRSSYSFSFVLLGLIALADCRIRSAYLFALLACLTHKGCVLYALSIPFCHFFLNRRIPNYIIIVVFGGLISIAAILRDYFVLFTSIVNLGGVYGSYAENANSEGNALFYTPSLGQYVLGIILLVFTKDISRKIEINKERIREFRILRLSCVFDLWALPLSLLIGNWRAYEFLFLPRLCMWAMFLAVLYQKNRYLRKLLPPLILLFFIFWIIYRLNKTYEDTCLMPYYIDIF